VNPSGLAEHVFEGDLVLVAPATADVLGKAAAGICSDGVTTLLQSALGQGKPVFVLPTMHDSLAASPLVRKNLETLASLPQVHFLEPRREEGKLKAPEPKLIALEIAHRWNATREFEGRAPRVAITLGGTRVSLDPVRCITNHSSGRLGFQVAEALYRRGLSLVVLQCQTRGSLSTLQDAEIVETPEFTQLANALENLQARATAGVFHIAAVSDFVPAQVAASKIPSDTETLTLKLTRTPKLLALPNLKDIPFQLACKLTSGDRAEGLETARSFARKNRLQACLWNHSEDAFGSSDADHTGILLVATSSSGYEERPVRSKEAIAEAMADAFMNHIRTKG
jgi:phosphopantothenoylcysteine decarboxylase/phosphopantothenate--cysteine ligase